MASNEAPIHILLVSFPAQGHINPLLRLGKCLAAEGASVIFTTTEKAGKDMGIVDDITNKLATPTGDGSLIFEFFDHSLLDNGSVNHAELERIGRQFVSQMIRNHADSNKPISCVINNPFLPWVCDIAFEHNIPSALLWTNSSAVFAVCYDYVHKLVPFPSNEEPYIDVQLNSSIVLKYNEIPDYIHPFNPFPILGTLTTAQIKDMSKVFCVLVDTFEELEHDLIDYISKKSITIRHVGPLFKNPKANGASNNTLGDFTKSNDDSTIIEWLNTKPKGSVVYISFGTIVNHTQEQVNEIAYGLLNSQVSFLWVLKQHVFPDGFLEETSGRGKVVKWSPQEQVLAHSSVACFITHCGWNSSMEAITLGVPMLTFPAFGDQLTNAKFLVDVFGVGIRLGYGDKKLVTRDEVKKCLLEAITGEKAERLKQNAMKWKTAAEDAMAVGGSSDRHLDAFIQDIKKHGTGNIQKM